MDRGRRRRPGRAQSSVIGVVLIIGMTLAAASAVVMFGSAALDEGNHQSQVGQAEQAMTQFDSRAAQVALGESTVQTVRVGGANGQYSIDPEAGHVTIVHENRTGDGEEDVIYSKSLGTVDYTLGDTVISYQGGGVWRSDGSGSSMVSSPEFHYRDATLTFPIIRVSGEGNGAGDISARVSRSGPPNPVFPRDENYPDSGPVMENPISSGTMKVTVQSQYCGGWKRYFESRTDGNVTSCTDGNVTAEIYSIGTQGEFPIANEPELTMRGVEDFAGGQFDLTFRVDQDGAGQNSGFNNFEWSMSAEEGDKQFEVYIEASDGQPDCSDGSPGDVPVNVVMYYSADGGENYETWQNDQDFTIECEGSEPVLRVDFLSSTEMSYTSADVYERGGKGQSLPRFRGDAESHKDSTSFDETTYPGDKGSENIDTLMQYYVVEMGDMNLNILEGNNAGISDASSGNILYTGDGRVITFLHITENNVTVELD